MNMTQQPNIEEGMGQSGKKYFFVKYGPRQVVAAFDKAHLEAYLLDQNSVEFRPDDGSGRGWNWIKKQLYVPNRAAISTFERLKDDTTPVLPSVTLTETQSHKLTEIRDKMREFIGDIDGILGS